MQSWLRFAFLMDEACGAMLALECLMSVSSWAPVSLVHMLLCSKAVVATSALAASSAMRVRLPTVAGARLLQVRAAVPLHVLLEYL
jgi:hypothetical protein